jgi:hypothetical protein
MKCSMVSSSFCLQVIFRLFFFLSLADYLASILLPFACLRSFEDPVADMYDVEEVGKGSMRKFNKR